MDGSFYCYHMLNDVLQDLGSMFSTENPGQQPKVSSIVSQHAFYVSTIYVEFFLLLIPVHLTSYCLEVVQAAGG